MSADLIIYRRIMRSHEIMRFNDEIKQRNKEYKFDDETIAEAKEDVID